MQTDKESSYGYRRTRRRGRRSKAETVTVAAIEAGVPTLVEAREIIAEFHLMIRRGAAAALSSALMPVSLPHSPAALRLMKRRFGRQSPSLVQRTDRRADHPPPTRETADVPAVNLLIKIVALQKLTPNMLVCCAACFVAKHVVGMLIVETIARIRREHIKGKTIKEIARAWYRGTRAKVLAEFAAKKQAQA